MHLVLLPLSLALLAQALPGKKAESIRGIFLFFSKLHRRDLASGIHFDYRASHTSKKYLLETMDPVSRDWALPPWERNASQERALSPTLRTSKLNSTI